MASYKPVIAAVIVLGFLALTGCGSSGGTSRDPLASGQQGNDTGTTPSNQTQNNGSVIMFTSAAGTMPGSQTNLLTAVTKEIDPGAAPAVTFLQLIPFKLTDAGGNPRPGVPVRASVYSLTTLNPDDVAIGFLMPPVTEATQQTVTTDSAGQGIFSAAITLASPTAGSSNTVAVVFKAESGDTPATIAYVGNTYSVTAKLPTPAITPTSAAFGSATELRFTISGGSKPYTVSSSNTQRVTATMLADGTTVSVQLADPGDWTGSVTISVTDASGKTASATVTRQ
ncbi:hypothetical protein GMSM_23370 [Geomonas sp. Red276]